MRLAPGMTSTGAIWLGFFAVILAAWGILFAMVVASPSAGVPEGLWQALCGGAGGAGFGSLLGMWLLMSAAMMLPTFVPALRTFLDLGAAGATAPVDAVALIAGYGLVWLGGAILAALAQGALSRTGLLAPDGSSLSLWLTSTLLIAAGLYQFTGVKAACLSRCRMPLTFFIERWAPGVPRAFRMGLDLGVLCFGCCWALMALAFVGGTMNLLWMGAATVFMVVEKLPDIGRRLTRSAGYALLAASVVTTLLALSR